MKIGIYNPYLDILGGGERYILTIASCLQEGNEVEIFWDKPQQKNQAFDPDIFKKTVGNRLNINIQRVKFQENVFVKYGLIKRFNYLRNFDLLFIVSDGSIPLGMAKKNILHFQVPFKRTPDIGNSIKLLRWNSIIVNSSFTKKIIDSSYNVNSIVVYPPVDTANITPLTKKNIILSVGRFFSPLHNKNQEFMIKSFINLCKEVRGWKLILAGGIDKGSEHLIRDLKNKIINFPIEIIPNADFSQIKRLFGESKIYWHAAGLGIDENYHPEHVEHFGISTVEAMAAGCVPIVVPYGGQREIVEDKITGFYYYSEKELISRTKYLIENDAKIDEIKLLAMGKVDRYSKENFCQKIHEIIQ